MSSTDPQRPSNGESSTSGSGSTTTNSGGRRSRSRPNSAGGGTGSSRMTSHAQEASGSSRSHRQPVRIGQYTLQQTLGTGSFGKVKLATHSLTGHRVAMKIINRRKISTLEMGGRVKREIQYLKLLRHPHIIKLYEVITTPNDIIMVIEYAGGELFQYIVDRGRMSEDEARRFFQQIICAIEYCHRHKIVHRDLKPENLLLDEFLNVKIGDFGLSNIMTDGDFLKTSCGSPNYAAPEVISGKLYAGPEIDIWSCGVILYVMLCGRLPFDDEYIPTLFKKINGGIYTLPSYLSPEAKHLLSSMLIVDPVKRITIAEIRQLPWFNQGLPSYLQPLPPTPAAEPSGFDFGMSATTAGDGDLGSEDRPTEARELYGPGVGILEEEIVAELSEKMMGFSHEDVLQHLLEPGDNQVKVAYQLVRDHKKLLQSAQLGGKKEMQGFLATSPPPWNAGLDELMSRSTSIKRKGGRSRAGTGAPKPQLDAAAGGATTDDAGETSADPDAGNATDEANETFGSDEGGLTDDDFSDDDEEEPHTPAECGIALLKTSLHRGDIGPGGQPSGTAPPPAPTPKKSRSRWHFGIRSRSPPMEIMLELYRTLQVLGMEWKADPDLETGGSGTGGEAGHDGAAPAKGDDEAIKGEALFFLQTRWKVHNIIVRMNLQLYRVDATNYLVDFRNVGYTRLDPIPDPSSPPSASEDSSAAASQIDSSSLENALDQASAHAALRGKASLAPSPPEGRKEVCSPFLFLECATRLIVELAGGG